MWASEPFLGLLTAIWAYRSGKVSSARDVGPVWTLLGPIWASAGGKVPPFRLLAILESSFFL